jgi:hypothetical protein
MDPGATITRHPPSHEATMLTLTHGGPGQTRRDFLKVGTLGLGGLSLPWLLEAHAGARARVGR